MNSLKKLNKILFIFYLALQVGVGIFLSNIFIFPRLVSAWETSQSSEAVCVLNNNVNINYVNIKASFTNNDSNVNKAMNVVAKDNWTGQEVNLGSVAVGETKSGLIKTGQTSITNSTVTFTLTWTDGSQSHGGSDTKTVSYSALNCPQPVSTPTPTIPPASTPTSVPPTPTSVPATPTPVTTTQILIVKEEVIVTPTPAPKVQVLAAKTFKELPKTGPVDGILLGLLSLLPAGLIIKQKSKNMFTNKR